LSRQRLNLGKSAPRHDASSDSTLAAVILVLNSWLRFLDTLQYSPASETRRPLHSSQHVETASTMSPTIDPEPFNTADILNFAPLADTEPDVWDGFQLDKSLENHVFHLSEAKPAELPLLQLSTFQLAQDEVALESLGEASSVSEAADEEHPGSIPAPEEAESDPVTDIWALPEVTRGKTTGRLFTWNHFLDEAHEEPASGYLAEAGRETFDAITATHANIRIAPSDLYLESLFDLAMGRESQYFQWNAEHHEFVASTEHVIMSGFSPHLMEHVTESIISMGSAMRTLVHGAHLNEPNSRRSKARMAFRATVESVATAIQEYLQPQPTSVSSLLLLQGLLEIPMSLVRCLSQLHQEVARYRDDVDVVAMLMKRLEPLTVEYPRFHKILQLVTASTTDPLFSTITSELILSAASTRESPDPPSVQAINEWATILPSSLVALLKETHQSLCLAMEHSKLTGLGQSPTLFASLKPTTLFSWEAILAQQKVIEAYEQTFIAVIVRGEAQDLKHISFEEGCGESSASSTTPMQFEQIDFNRVQNLSCVTKDDPIRVATFECLTQDTGPGPSFTVPCEEALAATFIPIVSAQHRLLSFSLLKALVGSCDVSSHLKMLNNFHLFGNGPFAASVSGALFDSSMSSGEGRRRDGNTTGLRLQDRDTWPPASSELRLVLMGILSEHMGGIKQELQDAISFSLRDLPEDELEKCRDVNSIHALDFLRIQYRPSNSLLEAVISQSCLDKYDRIFKYLLRLLRVKSVAQSLQAEVSLRNGVRLAPRERLFRLTIQQFVITLADYSQNTAVPCAWAPLEARLSEIQTTLDTHDYDGTLAVGRSLQYLETVHSDALEAMLRALLLKERHAKARGLVEKLFGIILDYAASLRRQSDGKDDASTETTDNYYEKFTAHLTSLKGALQNVEGIAEYLALRLNT
jgi:hypothetical protein